MPTPALVVAEVVAPVMPAVVEQVIEQPMVAVTDVVALPVSMDLAIPEKQPIDEHVVAVPEQPLVEEPVSTVPNLVNQATEAAALVG